MGRGHVPERRALTVETNERCEVTQLQIWPSPTQLASSRGVVIDSRNRCAPGHSGEAAVRQYPEHRIPGRRQDGDLHGGKTVQAVFRFGFEEYGHGIAATLLCEKNLIAIQIPAQLMCDQNDTARGPALPARGMSLFNSQPFHRTQLAGGALGGNKSMS